MPWLCRSCACFGDDVGVQRCAGCGSAAIASHPELFRLAIAHIDADAFYAAVEKRRRPDLAERPVIVGAGRRGVVTAACYVARRFGVRSAMPIFKALRLCPDAVVIRPDFATYAAVGLDLRERMLALTPLVEPLSIDEAVLDLSGTEAVHRAPPAVALARFARSVEDELGLTVSIGLAPNRLLAKLAAEREKPRGFSVIGSAEARAVLAPLPVSALPGIGPKASIRLAAAGFPTLGALAALSAEEAVARLGCRAPALVRLARGEDDRPIVPDRKPKSISTETTFARDLSGLASLEKALWCLAEALAARLVAKGFAAAGVVLKLKTDRFVSRSRHARLASPTQLAEVLFDAARPLLAREAAGGRYRLLGLGAEPLASAAEADPPDLADPERARRKARAEAIARLRARFGPDAVRRGREM
ncbi:MAG: DNA polymerase IV [Elioraea sp.]|nr:DNA polymerase IV [Elioraea sp.]